VDEANDRTDMTLSMSTATAGSFLVVMLIAWRARPRPETRRTRLRGSRPWLWGIAATTVALFSPTLAAMAAIALLIWRQWSGMHRKTRAARRVAHDFPDALDLLVLSIRAGYLPAQAIVEIVPFLPTSVCPAFAAVDLAMQRGDRFADALARLHAQLGTVAQPLVDSLSAADRYGLPLAPVLERLSLEARQQRRRDTDAAARELPVRLAMPLVLCTLPSFVLLAIVPLLLGALSSLHT
jgi:tight adherence protein C